jgi:hypothetical protein
MRLFKKLSYKILFKIYLWYLYFRDIIVRNFWVNIKGIHYKNETYHISELSTFFYLLRLFPFFMISYGAKMLNTHIIYKIDNIYNTTLLNEIRMLPIILEFQIVDNNNKIYNYTSKIKMYDGRIPIIFIIKNFNIKNPLFFKIKYIHQGKIITKDINYESNKLLYNLFQN